ncbi:MAG TPA: hypothetical protein VGO03_04860 [Acidimicrobiia bacterium]
MSVSQDGGASWRSVAPPGFVPSTKYAVDALGGSNLIVTSGSQASALVVARSTDAGATWTSEVVDATPKLAGTPDAVLDSVDVSFVDPDHGFLSVTYGYAHMNPQGATLTTTDGATTWSATSLEDGPSQLLALSATSAVVVIGPAATELEATSDSGNTWAPLAIPGDQATASSSIASLRLGGSNDHAEVVVGYDGGNAAHTLVDAITASTPPTVRQLADAGSVTPNAADISPAGVAVIASGAPSHTPDVRTVDSTGSVTPIATTGIDNLPDRVVALSDDTFLASLTEQLCPGRTNCHTVAQLWRSAGGGRTWQTIPIAASTSS